MKVAEVLAAYWFSRKDSVTCLDTVFAIAESLKLTEEVRQLVEGAKFDSLHAVVLPNGTSLRPSSIWGLDPVIDYSKPCNYQNERFHKLKVMEGEDDYPPDCHKCKKIIGWDIEFWMHGESHECRCKDCILPQQKCDVAH